MDARYQQLAELLIDYSTELQPGERVLIEAFDIPEEMVIALVRTAQAAGGHPLVSLRNNRVMRALNESASEENLAVWADCDRFRMAKMQAYIGLRGSHNVSEMSGVSSQQMQLVSRMYARPVHFEQRVNHTKWCVLRWPTPSMAQLAEMSTAAFEEFYFRVCTLDYASMDKACCVLQAQMQQTDRVHIRGPGATDLTFSIKGIPVKRCCGRRNIPDGECFTAPVRDSVEGVIEYNTPTIYNGLTFHNIRLEFARGRIVKATAAGDSQRLETILNADEGARYIGEFAIAFNPYILQPMKDILFDEKIAGSLHFTPGNSYEDAGNGNRSEIHWDLVLIQRPEYGGGSIDFDGQTIRRDGLFVPESLQGLNPSALTSQSRGGHTGQ
ncbi:MAG: aminopeptidase [Pirellulaceae bacterium]|nr:aminopeptidase [Pirellulaceae bacterium]